MEATHSKEITYDDLSCFQQEVVDDALEKLDSHRSLNLELEEVDAQEAVRYDNFRRELEGTEIERGEMDEEDLKGYLKAGILRRNEEDNLEINAIWEPGHVDKLEENDMYDFEFGQLYVARDEEKDIEKAVYGDEDGYHSFAEHGGNLKFSFEDDVLSERFGRSNSNYKIEEMIAEFVAESEGIENKDEYIENFDLGDFKKEYNNTNLPVPKSPSIPDGGDIRMTDGDNLPVAAGNNLPETTEDPTETTEYVEQIEQNLNEIGTALERKDIGTAERRAEAIRDYVNELTDDFEEVEDAFQQYDEKIRDYMDSWVDDLDDYAQRINERNQSAHNAARILMDAERTLQEYDGLDERTETLIDIAEEL